MILIEYIDVNKLHNHPDNPRKNLGDLSELTESIRENGIMQNLTVVPWFSEITKMPADNGEMDGHYRVVIGHRRLAAAKLAGIQKVPCVIEEMDYKKQISTMLLENIQRSDLTPIEQAQGFQMMMDLGSSVADIVKDTGFSESTVRHRLKLTELDQDLLREKSGENISMVDLIKLEQIEDPEEKNKILEQIGTNNFQYQYEGAIRRQKQKQKLELFREKFKPYATIAEDGIEYYRYERIETWYPDVMAIEEIEAINAKDLCQSKEGLVLLPGLYSTSLYQPKEEMEEEATEEPDSEMEERNRQEKERTERIIKLRDICATMRNCRIRYARHISIKVAKENLTKIIRQAAWLIASDEYNWFHEEDLLCDLIGFEEPEDPEDDYDEQEEYETAVKKHLKQYPEVGLFQVVYCALEGNGEPFNWRGEYIRNRGLEEVYALLVSCGYEMSDEEQRILNGTHELYWKEAEQ